MPAKHGNSLAESPDRVLEIERTFTAPRELVWKAFTEKKHWLNWMGPRDYPCTSVTLDVRPGGKWRACLHAKDGSHDLWQGGTFYEIDEPEKLVYTFGWEDNPEGSNLETLVTIHLKDQGDTTLMQFRQSVFNTRSNRDGHRGGWSSAFDRLDDYFKAGLQ
jgi:uncharacterized protein YndB with AHSA1/START domain